MKVNPIPRIPGVEFGGEVVKIGEHVNSINVYFSYALQFKVNSWEVKGNVDY